MLGGSRGRDPMKKAWLETAILVLLALGIGLFAGSRLLGPRSNVGTLNRDVKELSLQLDQVRKDLDAALSEDVVLYFGRMTETDFYLVPERRSVKRNKDLPRAALLELIKGPAGGTGLEGLIPKGTRLRNLTVRDGTAYPDFSAEIRTNFPGGSRAEELLVYSIVNTLTEFPGIRQVQFLINGDRADTIGGHMGIDMPLKRDESLIRP